MVGKLGLDFRAVFESFMRGLSREIANIISE